MSLIGVAGYAGSGKDTVAKMIQYDYAERYGNLVPSLEDYINGIKSINISHWQIKKFASKLKQICAILLNCKESDFESSEFKESKPEILSGKTVRYLLQYIGTEVGRNINKDIWIESLFSEYRPTSDDNRNSFGNILDYSKCEFPNWIISDLRFINEAKAIKSKGGVIIRVNRSELKSTHASEVEVDSIIPDFTLDNSGTFEQTYSNLKLILNDIIS